MPIFENSRILFRYTASNPELCEKKIMEGNIYHVYTKGLEKYNPQNEAFSKNKSKRFFS